MHPSQAGWLLFKKTFCGHMCMYACGGTCRPLCLHISMQHIHGQRTVEKLSTFIVRYSKCIPVWLTRSSPLANMGPGVGMAYPYRYAVATGEGGRGVGGVAAAACSDRGCLPLLHECERIRLCFVDEPCDCALQKLPRHRAFKNASPRHLRQTTSALRCFCHRWQISP